MHARQPNGRAVVWILSVPQACEPEQILPARIETAADRSTDCSPRTHGEHEGESQRPLPIVGIRRIVVWAAKVVPLRDLRASVVIFSRRILLKERTASKPAPTRW